MPVPQPAGLSREDAQRLDRAVSALGAPTTIVMIQTRLKIEGIPSVKSAYLTSHNRRMLVRAAREVIGETEAWRALAALVDQLDPSSAVARGRALIAVAESGADTTAVAPPRERPERRARRLGAVQARADRLQGQVARLTHEKDDLVKELAAARAELAALKGLLGDVDQARAEVAERRRAAEQEAEHIIDRARREATSMIALAEADADAIGDVVGAPSDTESKRGPVDRVAAPSGVELPAPPGFAAVRLGYDPAGVDRFIRLVREGRVWVQPSEFALTMGGYDGAQVHAYLDELRRAVGG